MSNLINFLNDTLIQWKEMYDFSSVVNMHFSEDANGNICFNDQPFFMTNNLIIESSHFDAQEISFMFADHKTFVIEIEWPEEEPPYISMAYVGYIKEAFISNI